MGPLTNEALCLSTPKHNGKSGTGKAVPISYITPAVHSGFFLDYINTSVSNITKSDPVKNKNKSKQH
jgi:hypothetical protein